MSATLRHGISTAITLSILAGCYPESPAPTRFAEVTDSAGLHLTDFDLLFDGAMPEWSIDDVFSTASSGVELHRVVGARLLTDGSVAIANAGSFEILRISQAGDLLFRIGRYGEGPGEFRALTSVDASPSDQLLAYDASLARLNVFNADGQLVETRPLSTESAAIDLVPLAFGQDGSVIATYGALRMFGPTGVGRDSVPLIRFSAHGVDRETLGYWPGKQWAFALHARGSARAPLAFSRDVAYAGRNGWAVIGSTDSVDLTVVHVADSTVWTIRSRDTGAPIPETARREWIADAIHRFKSAPPELRDLVLRSVPVAYPAYEFVVIDDLGRVWIGEYPLESVATRRWVVVTRLGEIAGAVRLPRRSKILDVVGGHMIVLDKTDLDEESVRVTRVKT